MSGNIKIKVSLRDYKSDEKTNIRAFASVTFGTTDEKSGVTITNIAVVEKESKTGSKTLDFRMPTRSREDENGKKIYSPLAEIRSKDKNREDELSVEIRDAIIKAYLSGPDEKGFKRSEIDSNLNANMNRIEAYTREVTSEKNTHLRGFTTAYIGDIVKLNNIAITEGVNEETGEIFRAVNFPANGPDENNNYYDIFFTTKDIKNKIGEHAELDLMLQKQSNKTEEPQQQEESVEEQNQQEEPNGKGKVKKNSKQTTEKNEEGKEEKEDEEEFEL